MPKLTEIFDFKRLQQLQDNLAGMSCLSAQIFDEEGQPITRQSRPSAFCTLVKTSAACQCDCGVPDSSDLAAGRIVTRACRYSGAMNVYIPLVSGTEYYGCWVLYGLCEDAAPLSESALAASAMALDLSASLLTGAAQMLQTQVGMLPLARGQVSLVSTIQQLAQDILHNPDGDNVARMEHTAALLNTFMSTESTGMVVSDYETGRILCANRHYCDFMGIDLADAYGRRVEEMRGQEFAHFYTACTTGKMLEEDGTPREPVQWNDYNARHGVWLRCTNQLAYWTRGRLVHVLTFQNINDEQRTRDELSRLAYYDRQMNLPNSLKLSADLENVWHSVAAAENFLICFDISGLRKLNDAHGRRAGDHFLHTVVKWIEHQSFPALTVYRIEGDEFCIRLAGTTHRQAVEVAGHIYGRFADLWSLTINGQQISILSGISLSVIGLDKLSDDDELLNVIQRTLDISRREHKIVLYDEETDKELKAHIQVQLSLKKSVRQRMNGFAVHFQPIVDPGTGLWKGLEALCRWNSPEIGPVSPIAFIREAEQMGLIGHIGEFVLEESVRQCKEWGLDKLDDFFVSVNLSPVQIMSTTLINNTLDILRRHDFPGDKLSLEVTESTRLNFNDHTLGVIENLCNHGIMIALDDFGTGYSSFNNMKNLPVNFVKTDHSFIRGIEQDHYMQYFYNIITELAHKTGMKLVVEGVETQEQLEIMLKNGVDYIQGYYFGKPMPAEELEKHLGKFLHATPPSLEMALKTDAHSGTGREGYLITTGTFNLQTECMRLLLSAADTEKAVREVLAMVGAHFGVSRAYLFSRVEGTVYSNTHEWCATGIEPQKPALQDVDIAAASPSWLPLLRDKGMITASDISHLPADIYEPMAQQGIRALIIVPLGEDGVISGFMGFDDCASHRLWQSEEIVMLKNLAMMMESLLRKHRALAPGVPTQAAIDVLATMPIEAFIARLDGEILWISPALQQEIGNVVGRHCYKVLGGCDSRCEGCRAKRLLDEPGLVLRREIERGGRRLLVYTSLVNWHDGRQALLEYSMDITGYVAEQSGADPVEALKQALQMSNPLEALLEE